MLLFLQNAGSLPKPDNDFYIEYDPMLDMQDPMNITDSAYQTWPLINKLIVKSGLSIDHDLFYETGTNTRRRFCDAWDQDIRYVIGSGMDDNGHTVEGLFTDWNWDVENAKPFLSTFPYVYSYGAGNSDGADTSLWIRKLD